jgi:ABC-type Fe3+-siderophore transport system permease subunit
MALSPLEVLDTLIGRGTERQELIVFEFRLPRIVLALLVGLGMGTAGVVMQSLLRNDMASPGTLGVANGAGMGVLIFVSFFASAGVAAAILLPVFAFAGAMVVAVLIFLLSYQRNKELSPVGLILMGVALGTGFGAFTTFLTLALDEWQLDFMLRWGMGTLWGTEWHYLAILAPWTFALVGYVFYRARILNTLNLGNETATGLGLAVKREFLSLSIVSVALCAGSVALGGSFYFLGLISPHIARRLVGPNHKLLIPAASLVAALIILLADLITRTVDMGTNVPTGILIDVVSTPYFIYLLLKAR